MDRIIIPTNDQLKKKELKRLILIDTRELKRSKPIYTPKLDVNGKTVHEKMENGTYDVNSPIVYELTGYDPIEPSDIITFENNVIKYQIKFDEDLGIDSFRNVSKVELKAVTFPKIENEPYLVIDFDEFNDYISSNSNEANRCSSIVFFSTQTPGEKETVFLLDGNGRTFDLNPHLASLSHLNITIKCGNMITTKLNNDFSDSGALHHQILLEVTYTD